MTITLREMIVAESNRETFPAAHFFAQHLAASFGHSVAAVLFYGSCLRQATDEGLLLDFYVLVDRMSDAIKNPISASIGAVLSPNVYYREVEFEGRTLRAKVAVMTMSRFLRDTSPGCFASSIWARFSQATLVLYARTGVIRDKVQEGLMQAIDTMAHNTLPLLPKTFTAHDLWVQALTCTYGAELRPESTTKAIELVNADLPRYERITEALFGPNVDGAYPNTAIDQKDIATRDWRWRRIQGKTLNVLRLIKAAFTFQGGLDYAVWKIERHSGVKMELTDAERRHPLLTGLKLLPRLLKKGGLK